MQLKPTDGPHEGTFNGGDGGVQIGTVQAETGFKTEGVTSTQTARKDFLALQDFLGEGNGVFSRDLDFVTIFTSVTATGDTAVDTTNLNIHTGHEGHLGDIEVGVALQDSRSHSTLDGNENNITEVLHLHFLAFSLELGHLLLEVFHIAVLAGTIDDLVATHKLEELNRLIVASVGNDSIIDDTTILLADEGQSTFSRLKLADITDKDSLEELDSILTSPPTIEMTLSEYLI